MKLNQLQSLKIAIIYELFIYINGYHDILSTSLQHFTHTMKPSDPLLLANGTLRCWMYPAANVAISQHLVTPGFCSVTILLASSVQTLV